MKKGLILGSIAALGLSGTALADGFNYSYAEAGYVNADFDGPGDDADGFGLRGSVRVTDLVHAFATYSNLDLGGGTDLETIGLGVGLNWSLNPNLDLVSGVSYLRGEVGSFDDNGFGLNAGLRGRLNERLELNGGVQYNDIGDFGDETTFQLGARYFFTEMFALGADVGLSSDTTTWMLGGRISFNP